jgi:hypothetical protein
MNIALPNDARCPVRDRPDGRRPTPTVMPLSQCGQLPARLGHPGPAAPLLRTSSREHRARLGTPSTRLEVEIRLSASTSAKWREAPREHPVKRVVAVRRGLHFCRVSRDRWLRSKRIPVFRFASVPLGSHPVLECSNVLRRDFAAPTATRVR